MASDTPAFASGRDMSFSGGNITNRTADGIKKPNEHGSVHTPATVDDSSTQFSAPRMEFSGGNFVQGTMIVNNTHESNEALKELKQRSAPDAFHTSPAVSRQDLCTPGTRTVTLSHLRSLATSTDLSSPDVVWMHGPAGAGKSAIMRTLANTLEKDGLLLASFFFFRSESQRNTSDRFIPTLASQAWGALPATQNHITQAIRRNPHIFSRSAHYQSPHLLEKPLLAALGSTGTPLTIIVDGLDECTDEGGQTEIINAMVDLASSIRATSNCRVKIVIASRPEYEIKSTFDKLANNENITIFRLDSRDANIRLFYDEQFDKIRAKFGLSTSWPSKEEIEWLTDKTSGQYSFAGVSTRFMYGGDPVGRLKIIREGVKDDNLQPFEALDQLYATVLNRLPQDMRVPALLVLRCRLHQHWDKRCNLALEPLLHLPRGYVRSLSPYLSSLINFDYELTPYHASLTDFLGDPSRSGRFSMHVDNRTLSQAIQKGLLATLTSPSERVTTSEEFMELYDVLCRRKDNFVHQCTMAHPVPSTELVMALTKISLPAPRVESTFLLHGFLELLQKQFRHRSLYTTHPMLWYTIRYTLPHQIRLEWDRRTMSYPGISQGKVDLVFGIALAVLETLRFTWFDDGENHRKFYQYLDDELFIIDSLRGWNLVGQTKYLCAQALKQHLQTSLNASRFWSSMRSVLLFVSDRPSPEDAREGIIKLIHSAHLDLRPFSVEGTTFDTSPCAKCARRLSEIDDGLLNGLARLIGDDKTPLRPEEPLAMYRLVRTIETCWGNSDLIPTLANYTLKCLDMPRFRYLPSFLIHAQKRELEEVLQALDRRTNVIGSKIPRYKPNERKGLQQFIISQLRHHQGLVFFTICSLIVCLCVLYTMYWICST